MCKNSRFWMAITAGTTKRVSGHVGWSQYIQDKEDYCVAVNNCSTCEWLGFGG